MQRQTFTKRWLCLQPLMLLLSVIGSGQCTDEGMIPHDNNDATISIHEDGGVTVSTCLDGIRCDRILEIHIEDTIPGSIKTSYNPASKSSELKKRRRTGRSSSGSKIQSKHKATFDSSKSSSKSILRGSSSSNSNNSGKTIIPSVTVPRKRKLKSPVKIPSYFERYKYQEHTVDEDPHHGPEHSTVFYRIVLLDPDTLRRMMILQKGNVTSPQQPSPSRRVVLM